MASASSILEQQAFPVLKTRQIAHLRSFGTVKNTHAGEVLFDIADANYGLVVVLDGETEVVDRANADHVLRTSGPGEFNGELGLLNGQSAFAACIVRKPGKALLVPRAGVHEIIATIPELSQLLVTAFAARRQLLMQSAVASLTIIGRDEKAGVLRLLEFADRNRVPYRWLDPDNPGDLSAISACGSLGGAGFRVVLGGQRTLERPTPLDLARAIGLDLGYRQEGPSDLIVIGAGPAGLAAAVYGASEGLSTLVVEDTAIGGQAGTSSCIENYVGFPAGIAGGDLAFRAEVQAIKFGARITVPHRAAALEKRKKVYAVRLDDGGVLLGRSFVIATGARYRRLSLSGQEVFEGAGIYYAATELEARRCRRAEVVVVGGGNSAGQAAMFLSEHASRVHLLCRGPDLVRSMSEYLLTRIQHTSNVDIRLRTEITQVRGGKTLESVTIANRSTGESQEVKISALFVMIGADPCTAWLRGTVLLDGKGFVRTGPTFTVSGEKPETGDGAAFSPYQTDLPGVFAVGDVRSGSVKRVASAVGEGSVVVQAVHQHLANLREPN
jgi:thioredoxin reductase (NADPH)